MSRETTAHNPDDLVYGGNFLGRKYEIQNSTPEQIEQWKTEVQEFVGLIKEKNIEKIKQLVGSDNKLFNFEELAQAFNEEDVIDDETAKLWGIGMWLMKNQPRWLGNTPVLKKIFSGNIHNIEDAANKEAVGNCMDSAVLAREMAKQLGFDGDIKSRDVVHRYMDSGTGILVDPWWAMPRGGIVRTWLKGDKDKWKNPGANFGDHICGK